MDSKKPPQYTLGPISTSFIRFFLEQDKIIFTLDEATDVYGKPCDETSKFLSKLVKRRILARLSSGIYLILQAGKETIQLNNWPLIAHEITKSRDYFISHYSAMRLHGMTTHPGTEVYITISKRRAIKHIGDITYRFIYSKPEHFWGGTSHWVTKQEQVYISDIERTLLDGFSRPELCGGFKDVVRGLWNSQHKINWGKLLEYAKKYHNKAAIKRLGYIATMLELEHPYSTELMTICQASQGYNQLDPTAPSIGSHIKQWGLLININLDELKTSIWT